MIALLKLLARLPLSWLHALGAVLGWAAYLASPRYAMRLRENLAASGVAAAAGERSLLRQAVAEAGRAAAELPAIWFRPLVAVDALIRRRTGLEHIEAAQARGRGVIFLTPHLGCFEITALYAASRFPLTVLYRRPKLGWLEPLLAAGRARGSVRLAPAELAGVRRLYRALRRGEAVGLLPDQVPGTGEGVWADFFGRPAYTMTLAGRLAGASGAAVILAFARRLPRGEGYDLAFEPLELAADDAPQAARQLNAAVERLVRRCPEQYLWSYNRYKIPAGVEPPA